MNDTKVRFLYDVQSQECKSLIDETISRHGFAPEHNYDYFVSYHSKQMKPVFADFGNHKGLFAIEWDDNSYQMLSEVMAPEDERCSLVLLFLKTIFSESYPRKVSKVLVEFPPELRKQLIQKLRQENSVNQEDSKENNIIIGNIIHHYYTPLIALHEWDTALQGPEFSKLRKAKGRFFRNFKVDVLKEQEVLSVGIDEFEKVIREWKKNRKSTDTAYFEDYLNFFRNKFKGSACHIALKLNGALCGVSAAWIVSNTNGRTVYYAINLHNYSVSELGDFLTVLFLDELKKQGFEYLDFGSSDEKLLAYKKKFKPFRQYETLCFYIRNSRVSK